MEYTHAHTLAQAILTTTPGHLDYRPADRRRNVRVASEPYPRTVAESLDPDAKYKPAVLRAMREFRAARPFHGSEAERFAKFAALHILLCEAHGIFPALHRGAATDGTSGGSFFRPGENSITLSGHLSVITYLHEFAHAMGKGERGACRWSLNLFRRIFPRSFARLVPVGHTLVRRPN